MGCKDVSAGRRQFFQHLSSYVIVIGGLALLNLLTSDFPWVVFPAIGWGIGLVFHFTEMLLKESKSWGRLSKKWRDFLNHLRSYIIVIGTLGLINLFTTDYPWFLWPAFGWGIGLASHFASTVFKEDKASEQAEEAISEEAFQGRGQVPAEVDDVPEMAQEPRPKREQVTNPALQAHLERARAYRSQIQQIIRASRDEVARVRLQQLDAQVADWVKAIEGLARRIESFEQNTLIHQDLATVPRAIEGLETRLAEETDPTIHSQLERTLANRKNQLAALEKLRRTINQAEIQIESTMSSLGTIYSQLLTGQSTDHMADYSRLSAEVDEEVRSLQDQLEALEEVKLGRY